MRLALLKTTQLAGLAGVFQLLSANSIHLGLPTREIFDIMCTGQGFIRLAPFQHIISRLRWSYSYFTLFGRRRCSCANRYLQPVGLRLSECLEYPPACTIALPTGDGAQ